MSYIERITEMIQRDCECSYHTDRGKSFIIKHDNHYQCKLCGKYINERFIRTNNEGKLVFDPTPKDYKNIFPSTEEVKEGISQINDIIEKVKTCC